MQPIIYHFEKETIPFQGLTAVFLNRRAYLGFGIVFLIQQSMRIILTADECLSFPGVNFGNKLVISLQLRC